MVHKLRGVVTRGNGLGHKLGFPTANIPVAADMPLRDGVYAAEINVDGRLWRAMVNVGTRPTVGSGGGRFAEANLFDFADDIYDKPVIIFLLAYMRPEQRFSNLEELKEQLARDRENVIGYFKQS